MDDIFVAFTMVQQQIMTGPSIAASKQAVAYCWHSPAWLFLV
jgi:hypothetical protein